MPTQISQRFRKSQQGFGLPDRLTNRKGWSLTQRMSTKGYERKQVRASAEVVCTIATSDIFRPAQDTPLPHLGRFCLLIGAPQGHRLIVALRIAHEHPTDHHRRDGRVLPQSRARGNLHRTCGPPRPRPGVCVPRRHGVGETCSQRGLLCAFPRMGISFSCFPSRRGWIGYTGIQTPSCHHTDAVQATADVQQDVTDGRRPVPHDHPCSTRQPARDVPEPQPGPIGDRLVPFRALRVGAFRGSPNRHKGPGPDALRPRAARQQQQRHPAQAIRLHTQRFARTNWITKDASCRHLVTASARDGFSDAHDHGLFSSHTQPNPQHPQHTAHLTTRPRCATRHAMVMLKWLFLRASHHAPDGPFPHVFAHNRLTMGQHVSHACWQRQPVSLLLWEAW
jgi:hypothetical protein